MPVGLPGLAAACFILGVLLYSTVVRAEYPDIGSNFFPAVLLSLIHISEPTRLGMISYAVFCLKKKKKKKNDVRDEKKVILHKQPNK